MLWVKIDPTMSIDEFDSAAGIWLSTSDCSVDFPERLTEAEIRHLNEIAFSRLPNELAYCVLQSLAELDNTPDDILLGILETGERSCIESVCLRRDLPPSISSACSLLAEHLKDKMPNST